MTTPEKPELLKEAPKRAFTEWPSTTDAPIPAYMDDEGRRLAAGLAAATLAGGMPGNPLAAIANYTGGRIAAARPASNADLSGIDPKNPPKDVPELIESLLGPGRNNRILCIGEKHVDLGVAASLADPKTIAVMKKCGVTHVCLEITPDSLQGLREANPRNRLFGSGMPPSLVSYAANKIHPCRDIVTACDAAGITIVPKDLAGPEVQKLAALIDAVEIKPDLWRALSLKMNGASEDKTGLERHRVSNHSWAPRIIQAAQEPGAGKIVDLGGDAHYHNHLRFDVPDLQHADTNEMLAKTLKCGVVYVRLRNDDTLPADIEKLLHSNAGTTPDLTLTVPKQKDIRFANAPLRLQIPEKKHLSASLDMMAMDDIIHQWTLSRARHYGSKPIPDGEYQRIDRLIDIRNEAFKGNLESAKKNIAGLLAELKEDKSVRILDRIGIGFMEDSLNALQRHTRPDEPPEKRLGPPPIPGLEDLYFPDDPLLELPKNYVPPVPPRNGPLPMKPGTGRN